MRIGHGAGVGVLEIGRAGEDKEVTRGNIDVRPHLRCDLSRWTGVVFDGRSAKEGEGSQKLGKMRCRLPRS
jgi:hypothetical protein